MKQPCRVVPPCLLPALLLCCGFVFAQKPEPRIQRAIDDNVRVTLTDSRTPRTRTAEDLGVIAPDTSIPGITLVLRRSTAQETALQTLLDAQGDPASPLYHHWLTPETFAARFGMADADITAIQTWLQSRGFHIDAVARSRDRITFSGSAAQVQAAFGAELHQYRTEGELHMGPASDLSLPTDLASLTSAVLHLSDFRPKPNLQAGSRAHPDFTALSTQAHYLTPKDLATMYDLAPLYSGGFWGSGQQIAIVGQSYVDTSNTSAIQTFQANTTQYNPVTPVLVPNSGVEAISPDDEAESEIDIEYASGIAQNATILLVYVGANKNYNFTDALSLAITENIAPVISISYGICEPLVSGSELDQANALFEEATAQGQTLVAASGDSGSTSCAPYTSSSSASLALGQALAVNFPADSPYVTAVGGTQMAPGTFTAGTNPYWANAGTLDLVNSLQSYVPEVVWNEGSVASGIVAGGGGTSTYFPRPSWQNGLGVPTGGFRLLPDVALQASVESPGFLLCSGDPVLLAAEGQTGSCVDGLVGNNNHYTVAGGTSFAAPVFAGFLAILNEVEHATGQGNVNPTLYRLATNPATAALFHDITSGTNACKPGAQNCATPGESAYAATMGYDEATGLGSFDFNAMAMAWPAGSTSSLAPSTILLTATAVAVAPGTSLPIQISVQPQYVPGGLSLPTGSVSVSIDGMVMNPSLPLSVANTSYVNSIATYTFIAPSATGSHLVTVAYPGDAKHAASEAVYSVLVGNVLASGGLSLQAGNVTVANGGTGSTQVLITPSGGYNGRLVWSITASSSAGNLSGCYLIRSVPVSGATSTGLTIGVGTACNSPLSGQFRQLRLPIPHTAAANHAPEPWQRTSAMAVWAGLIVCGSLMGRGRRARLPIMLVFGSLGFTCVGLGGCGGGSSSAATGGTTTKTTPGTAPGTTANYTLTLTGKDSVNSAISASTTFTLTVD